MTPKRYSETIEKLGLTQVAAGHFLGISDRQSRRYIAGDREIPRDIELLLDLMVRLKLTAADVPERALPLDMLFDVMDRFKVKPRDVVPRKSRRR